MGAIPYAMGGAGAAATPLEQPDMGAKKLSFVLEEVEAALSRSTSYNSEE